MFVFDSVFLIIFFFVLNIKQKAKNIVYSFVYNVYVDLA